MYRKLCDGLVLVSATILVAVLGLGWTLLLLSVSSDF